MDMITVSSREFRSKQKNYLDKVAEGAELLITRGKHEAFKVTRVTEDDTLVSKEAFIAHVEKAIEEMREGKVYQMSSGETLDGFLSRMEKEGNV